MVDSVPDDQRPHPSESLAGVPVGPIFGIALAAVSALALVAWSLIWPASFDERVTARMRSRWRTWRIYRHPWTTICTLHGLTATLGERALVPTLRSVTIGTTYDIVEVQILIGQSVADWQNKAPALAEGFRAQRLTIRSATPVKSPSPLTTGILLPTPSPCAGRPRHSGEPGAHRHGRDRGRQMVASPGLGASHLGRRRDRFRKRLGALVARGRPCPRDSGRLDSSAGGRPQGRHGIWPWTETIQRLRLRQRPRHTSRSYGLRRRSCKSARSDCAATPGCTTLRPTNRYSCLSWTKSLP